MKHLYLSFVLVFLSTGGHLFSSERDTSPESARSSSTDQHLPVQADDTPHHPPVPKLDLTVIGFGTPQADEPEIAILQLKKIAAANLDSIKKIGTDLLLYIQDTIRDQTPSPLPSPTPMVSLTIKEDTFQKEWELELAALNRNIETLITLLQSECDEETSLDLYALCEKVEKVKEAAETLQNNVCNIILALRSAPHSLKSTGSHSILSQVPLKELSRVAAIMTKLNYKAFSDLLEDPENLNRQAPA